MSEQDINRWHDTIAPSSRAPQPWTVKSGGSWDMLDVAPIPDEMLQELARASAYAGTPWNCRSLPLSRGDREHMYLLHYSSMGLISRMRRGERMVAELVELLRRMGSDVPEAERATDEEWDAVVRRAEALLDGRFEEARGS